MLINSENMAVPQLYCQKMILHKVRSKTMKRLPNSTLKEGDHVTVVKISKSDAYWSDRKYFIGRSGRIESIHERNWPWAFASIIFDKETDNGQLSGIFYSVLLKRA